MLAQYSSGESDVDINDAPPAKKTRQRETWIPLRTFENKKAFDEFLVNGDDVDSDDDDGEDGDDGWRKERTYNSADGVKIIYYCQKGGRSRDVEATCRARLMALFHNDNSKVSALHNNVSHTDHNEYEKSGLSEEVQHKLLDNAP